MKKLGNCIECKEEIGPFAPHVWESWIKNGLGDPGKMCCECLSKKVKVVAKEVYGKK